MTRRLLRSTYCFLAVVMIYWCYATVMVPLLEPTVARKRPRDFLANPLEHTTRSKAFERLFTEDAWERKNAKVLETEHGALLFRDYLPQADGTMELKPVTLVYYTADSGAGSGGLPILIQAPQGAVLQSDRPINLSRGDFGKPVGARLLGQIIIRRPATSPDHDDELFVTTRNVKIDRQRIWTPNDVEFRFGPHWGRGRDLQITFDTGDALGTSNRDSTTRPGGVAAGIQTLELMQIDKILISPAHQTLSRPDFSSQALSGPVYSGQASGASAGDRLRGAESDSRQVPIEVRCRGVFRFDFPRSIASLTEDVRLVQRYPGGMTDSVRCEILELHFASTDSLAQQQTRAHKVSTSAEPPIDLAGEQREGGFGDPHQRGASAKRGDAAELEEAKPTAGPGSQRLAIARVLAQGAPVTLDAPSHQVFAEAEQVEMFFGQQRLVLEGTTGARLRFGQRTFHSPRIEYAFHPDEPKRLGQVEAEGPGQFQGRISDDDPRRFTATWEESMRLRPLEDRQVLSLYGRPAVELQATGKLTARQLHMFLHESAPPTDSSQGDAAASLLSLTPDRLVAIDDVRLHTDELQGHALRELKVWFVEPEPNMPGAPFEMNPANAAAGKNRQPLAPLGPGPPEDVEAVADPGRRDPPIQFQGERVEARVVLGDDPQLTDLTVAGKVEITRPSEKPDTAPLRIAGELLQLSELGAGDAHIEVRGKPAEAGAEGLVLRGGQIFCQQSTNQLWIPGPGQMLTPSAAPGIGVSAADGGSSSARPASAPPLAIDWKGRMQFDGRLASFLDGVHVHGQQVSARGEASQFGIRGSELQVELTRRVDFSQPGGDDESELGIRLLRFPGQVLLENQTRQSDGQPASWEQMEVTHLRVDPVRGRLEADGPGWLSSVRVSGNSAASPGFPVSVPQKSSGLAHIRVGFQRAVVGNLQTREVEFFEHVLTSYGPGDDWHDRIDPVRGALAQGGVEMHSDRLRLTEMRAPGASAQAHYEIQAVGNVEVRGERFQASGYRLSYDDSKDLLILQGNGREYAVVKTPETNGVHEVKELRVWPKSKKIQSDVRSIDLGPVGSRPR